MDKGTIANKVVGLMGEKGPVFFQLLRYFCYGGLNWIALTKLRPELTYLLESEVFFKRGTNVAAMSSLGNKDQEQCQFAT